MSDTLLVSTRKGLFTLRREKKQWAICAVDFIGDNVSIMPCNSSNGYPHDCESGQWSCAIPSNTVAARVASMAIIIDAVFLQSGFT